MRTFDDMLNEQLKDINFKKEYEDIQPEMDVIRAIVDARTAQNLTQKELSKITGINQADISKLENGTRNPTVSLLKRLAEGMGMELRIQFIPKNNISV
nr:helix-turn-helix transcriptional regulator [uncultured Lachnoanaerobaculum sp.]